MWLWGRLSSLPEVTRDCSPRKQEKAGWKACPTRESVPYKLESLFHNEHHRS